MFERFKSWLTRRARSEEGTSTVPFMLFVPLFMTMVMSSTEMGTMLFRQVMLERGLDMAVRDLRLGAWVPADSTALKRRICNYAGVIPSCMNAMLVELRPVSKSTWSPLSSGPVCVDRSAAVQPVTTFVAGTSNDMMLIRACVKFVPIFPTNGFGFGMPKDATGAYALVSSTAFVNEPRPGT